jgi:hypothetical protein
LTAASAIWRAAIEAALAKDDLKPAIALHQQAIGSPGTADAVVLDRYINAARERQAARDYVARLLPSESHPSSRQYIEQSPAELDAAHEVATAQNNKDWPVTDSQRATNQHFIDVVFGQRKRRAVETQADLDQRVSKEELQQSSSKTRSTAPTSCFSQTATRNAPRTASP